LKNAESGFAVRVYEFFVRLHTAHHLQTERYHSTVFFTSPKWPTFRRLGWAGHIIRMEEERIPKNVLNGTFHITRPVGRPRTRWADVVQRDALQLLGVGGWRRRAETRDDRDEWRHALREAKARKGL
jgi:hypothetical protein